MSLSFDNNSSARPAAPNTALSGGTRWQGRRWKGIANAAAWLILGSAAVTMLFPLFWMVVTSLKSEPELYQIPPALVPARLNWGNYLDAFGYIPYWRMLANSSMIAALVTAGRVLTSTFAGFSFARLRYPGRDLLFLLYLAVLMVPFPVTMVPLYLIMRAFGWLDSYNALIVPAIVSAYNTFLARQFMLSIPRDLDDAARIDGANPFTIYWRVVLPLCKPVIAVITVFSFMQSWNSFIWPLLVINSAEKFTIPLGLAIIAGGRDGYGGYIAWNYLMAAATASAVPMIVIFLLAQRYFIQGIAMSGIKG